MPDAEAPRARHYGLLFPIPTFNTFCILIHAALSVGFFSLTLRTRVVHWHLALCVVAAQKIRWMFYVI
jgi:hypothetical protein